MARITELYDNVKMLVFSSEPWKLLGTHALAINEDIQYALVKCTYKDDVNEDRVEYLLLAEKRIAEFTARA